MHSGTSFAAELTTVDTSKYENTVKFLPRTFSEVNGLAVAVVDNYPVHRPRWSEMRVEG